MEIIKTEKYWREKIQDVLNYTAPEDIVNKIYMLMEEFAEENPVEAEPDTSLYEGMKDLD